MDERLQTGGSATGELLPGGGGAPGEGRAPGSGQALVRLVGATAKTALIGKP